MHLDQEMLDMQENGGNNEIKKKKLFYFYFIYIKNPFFKSKIYKYYSISLNSKIPLKKLNLKKFKNL